MMTVSLAGSQLYCVLVACISRIQCHAIQWHVVYQIACMHGVRACHVLLIRQLAMAMPGPCSLTRDVAQWCSGSTHAPRLQAQARWHALSMHVARYSSRVTTTMYSVTNIIIATYDLEMASSSRQVPEVILVIISSISETCTASLP